MEKLKTTSVILLFLVLNSACADKKEAEVESTPQTEKSVAQIKAQLEEEGYKTFEFIDEESGDTLLLQQYFLVFLKSGPVRDQNKEVTDSLQLKHLAHLDRMYRLGYADISGPFGDDGEIRGLTIYNTPTLEMADSLARLDPMVQAGRLEIEVHPWWAAKGFGLR